MIITQVIAPKIARTLPLTVFPILNQVDPDPIIPIGTPRKKTAGIPRKIRGTYGRAPIRKANISFL